MRLLWRNPVLVGSACAFGCASMAPTAAGAQTTERASVGAQGSQANSHSWQAVISGNGRFVAFESLATNLVSGDSNGLQDIFVHDRLSGATVRVSVASNGTQANGVSSRPTISQTGRYISYYSDATNLVPDDTNGVTDVFVYDLQTGQTVRASVDSFGNQADKQSRHPSISADGRTVVFHSEATNFDALDTNPQWDVYAHDLDTGLTELVSLRNDGGAGNDWSEHAAVSGDGRLVVYHSAATNLVDGDTNGVEDIFLFDRAERRTTRLSLGPSGEQPNGLCIFPGISPDGRYVVFECEATNLVAGDTNGVRDILMIDLATSEMTRVSLGMNDAQANADCFTPAVGRGGRYVAFCSQANTLVPGDNNGLPDAFVRDRWTGETFRVSLGPGGVQANGGTSFSTMSYDGRYVAFQSGARNLVDGDTNMSIDVFVRDRGVLRIPPFRRLP
ncbi:MAG: hypothetical protein IPJ41_04240 [Phycisphaerales bacterium]|nr:hypothetical protein [Phycisphaerales bacterium]